MNDCRTLLTRLKSLVVFRRILSDPVMAAFQRLLAAPLSDETALADAYCDFSAALFGQNTNFSRFLLDLVLEDENIYTDCFITGKGDLETLTAALERELALLSDAAAFDGGEIRKALPDLGLIPWKTETIDFAAVYHQNLSVISSRGFGVFSKYRMFILDEDGALTPIKNPDPQRLSSLYGYENEREKIILNTKAFLAGKPANNVLLYGDAGTGKSSSVKAIVNEFFPQGLRLIELKKTQLYLIPKLMDSLALNPLKFILFIDDLTFTSDDRDFCALKAILEGSVNNRGDNILIYVTSNHRHLIKETYSDRAGDEISVSDKLQEMTSLSARFGLTVTFSRPDKELYEAIVQNLADQAGITLDSHTLMVRAEAHAIRNGGRNPRTARQFVDMLASETLADE